MPRIKTAVLRIAGASAALFLSYSALLCVPQPLFSFSAQADNLTLHSDRQFSAVAAQQVLALAEAKLATSPLYSKDRGHHVFLCNARWRQMLFFNKDYGVGGVAPYPLSPHVFLRDAEVEDNRLISPRGTPVAGDRTLDYFIAHEITHQLTGEAIGPLRYYRLPQWVREGYADYVGKGNSFNYAEARRAFLAGAPEMDWKRSGLYCRFHLLVAYELDHRGWSVARLLKNPPPQETVEAEVVAETP
ncbi:MAG TPA: hypothetical protein VKG25_23775 [Bryobacteraceae bacterium]|nr:hypothetical protein [Bryobacteraceae bacterium]